MVRRRLRLLSVLLSALAICCGLVGLAQAQQRHVLLLDVNGIIGPVTEGFIARGVRKAENDGATLIVIRLDTPGGLLDSTRKITQHLLNAKVPSVVYVAPSGAQAASAGTFITAAATFAVMSPGSNIGAASPVGPGGEELPETIKSKVTNDAAAEIRSLAALRGRSQEQLEATVLKALSFTAEEAVKLEIVDFISTDLDDLLAQLHGQEAVVPPPDGQRLILDTQGLAVRTMDMSLVERFLRFLSHPNVSFLLLSLGGLGIFVELLNPGLVLPGVAGAILLVLSFVTLGNLPVNWAGVVLILLAVVLGVLEVYVSGFGVLAVGAIVSFVLGSLLLFFHTGAPSPTMPSVRVSLWLLVPTAAILTVSGAWVMSTIIRSRQGQPEAVVPSLLGVTGFVITELAPRGTVQVAGEEWTAVSEDRRIISKGQEIQVTSVSGTTLTVVPAKIEAEDSEEHGNGYNSKAPADSGTGG